MDNGQFLKDQTYQPSQVANEVPTASSALPPVHQPQINIAARSDNTALIKTIVIVFLSLLAVTFLGLFIWMYIKYSSLQSDVGGEINTAVAEATQAQAQKDEAEFMEREKYPYKSFVGPVDYGQLSFEYPKTWSVYVAADAANGGDYSAYFNPNQVDPISKTTINALRVTIRDTSFENVAAEYQRAMDKKDSNLTMQTITINNSTANRYSGKIPNTDFNGIIVVIKIRDKTVVLQTDSVLFEADFNKLVETISFNA